MSSKKKQRREYDEEFKREAVRLAKEEGMKSSKVERDLGIANGELTRKLCLSE